MIMYNSNKESDSPWFENGTQSNFKKISQLQVTNRKEQSLNSENMKASYEEQSVISPITNSLMELYGMNNSQIGQKLKNQQQQQQLWEAAASPSLGLKQESFINSNLSSNIDNSSNSKANMNNTNSNINYLPYQPQQQQAMLGTRYAYQWPWQQQSFSKPNISNNIVNHSNIFTDNLSSPDVELQQTSPMHLKPLNVSSKSPTSYPGEPYPRLVKINNSQSHESQYQDNNSNRNLSDTTSDPTQQIESEDINLKRKVSSDYSEYDSEKNEIGNDKNDSIKNKDNYYDDVDSNNMKKKRKTKKSKVTSQDIYTRYAKPDKDDPNEMDCSQILSYACYVDWLKSRKKKPPNGPEAFRKTLVSYVTCADKASKPFPPAIERGLLKLLREKRTWPCFENMVDPVTKKKVRIGHNGLRCVGFHESQEKAREALQQKNNSQNNNIILLNYQQQMKNHNSFANQQQQQNQLSNYRSLRNYFGSYPYGGGQ